MTKPSSDPLVALSGAPDYNDYQMIIKSDTCLTKDDTGTSGDEVGANFIQMAQVDGMIYAGSYLAIFDKLDRIPDGLVHIAEAIEKSKNILELEDNWDGEGSCGYSQGTWHRAVKFLYENSVELWDRYGIKCNAPAIYNGPAGSLDLYWEIPGRRLLINIPEDKNSLATYYGFDDENGTEQKGTLSLKAKNQWLILWQMG